ncbi:MAG: WYL domain-containing protein [Clostridia bacterium]|nr:WYL domain-containing protein [Clostridia bacterium]
MNGTKQYRLLEIFFRALRGEDISVSGLAAEYGVSSKSISRSIAEIKAFLADRRELVGNTELEYSYRDKCYRLEMDELLSSKELFALVEVMIGARAFSAEELHVLINKLKGVTTPGDGKTLSELIRKELYHYPQVRHECESVQDNLWQLINCINDRKEITIDYYRMDRSFVTHRLIPASVMFSDYYFYLIAFSTSDLEKPLYFRIDRIKQIVTHRKREKARNVSFDEGKLRRQSLYMWPGKLRNIRFEFAGPSVQAVLDKLPTARIIERMGNGRYLIGAETYGDGIKMWLLSQGSWVKVTAPEDFVEEMKRELIKAYEQYDT